MVANDKEDEVTKFLKFVSSSPTPYHAIETTIQLLTDAGFEELDLSTEWNHKLVPGGKYFLTCNYSSIIAFSVGTNWAPGGPFAIVAAHTDSPCLRCKPTSNRKSGEFHGLSVEPYGGGLWHTWFDRDLSLAGQVQVSSTSKASEVKLFRLNRPILRVPTLAAHLDRSPNFCFNKETHLSPFYGLNSSGLSQRSIINSANPYLNNRINPSIIKEIAEQLNCEENMIEDCEMILYDTQEPCLGGLANDLIFSSRLDNLMMSFCAVQGLINSLEAGHKNSPESVRMVVLFDNEEIGSQTKAGALSNFLPNVMCQICLSSTKHSVSHTSITNSLSSVLPCYNMSCTKSVLISADMAHSIHPNYADKHDETHHPVINGGPVIKYNTNGRYATSLSSSTMLQKIASIYEIPIQFYANRNDTPCGSTIGPFLSSMLGIHTIDLGNPQLSMHSIRETGGAKDIKHAIRLFDGFWQEFDKFKVDANRISLPRRIASQRVPTKVTKDS